MGNLAAHIWHHMQEAEREQHRLLPHVDGSSVKE